MSKYMTTAVAAEHLDMKPGDLTAFVNKLGISIEKCGRAFLWTDDDLVHVQRIKKAVDEGRCVHCGAQWNRPTGVYAHTAPETPPAAPEEG